MRRLIVIVLVVLLVAGGGGFAWWYMHRGNGTGELVLYGNVDLRQADLAFVDSGRITQVQAQEGDVVKPGQLLARLDTSRLAPQIDQADAQVAAAEASIQTIDAQLDVQSAQIAAGQAQVNQAEAALEFGKQQAARYGKLQETGAGTIESAEQYASQQRQQEASLAAARATLNVAERQPETLKAQRASAVANLHQAEAQLALLRQQLKDADLTAPAAGVIRSRLLEPGEATSPQRPVFSLAVVDPKWVRAYAAEPDLARIAPGMRAFVTVDGLPGRSFDGWIGFISPVAEFTPKAVQTEELRTSLVYEVRVFVKDAENRLRLGMPATVHLAGPAEAASKAAEAKP
jgi:HlyD family secretion protein